MKREMIVMVVFLASLGAVYVAHSVQGAAAAEKKKLLRVGVYDSRAVPMAWTYSQYNDNFMQKTSAAKKEAEAAGDFEKAQALEEQMEAYRLKRHKQVFSTAPVHDLLTLVEPHLLEMAKREKVDVVVSKWEFDYLADDAEVVDVTREIATLFDPDPGVMKRIQELTKKQPLQEKEIERLDKEQPH